MLYRNLATVQELASKKKIIINTCSMCRLFEILRNFEIIIYASAIIGILKIIKIPAARSGRRAGRWYNALESIIRKSRTRNS